MFFENEKDTIKDGAEVQISDDGTVIWDDILDTSDDNDIIIIDDEEPQKESKPDIADIPSDFSDEVDNNELLSILDDTTTETENTEKAPEESFEPDELIQNVSGDEEEFDLDKQLNNINLNNEDSSDSDFKVPEKKQKSNISTMMVLIALLFAILLAGGVYYAISYFKDQDVSNGDLQRNQTVEDTMNNVTKEDIEQRNEEDNENIPVVNEDETDLIKPDEIPEEEKKEVITVIPTGRSNPFMPIQKYVKVEIPETVVRYDRANLIKPPKEFGVENEATTKMLTIAVSGIMYDSQKPSAIISFENNDYFVQKGDKLDDYRVVDIGKNYVTVALGKNLYKANIGEEFKLTEFYGSAKYLTDKYDGGRQYRSVGDIKENNTIERKQVSPTDRYVSDSDVEINVK